MSDETALTVSETAVRLAAVRQKPAGDHRTAGVGWPPTPSSWIGPQKMTPAGSDNLPSIPRHKTAIRRPDLSLPLKCLLRDGLLDASGSLFDYRCGYGQDIERLQTLGIACDGWDPHYRPDVARANAPVVNLGYVLNVIEDPQERAEALLRAWGLCDGVLVVSAIGPVEVQEGRDAVRYADGILTSRGTFQKHYHHQELRAYLEQQLPCDAVPAAPNVFYLFKSEAIRQQFLAGRFRRRLVVPRQRVTEQLFRDLATDPNPALALRVKVDLPNLSVDFFDTSQRTDPPRLGLDPNLLVQN